jgi:hypothetical protein
MTIPSSGPVTFTDIQTEFGGTNPIALNEYYAGGTYVPAGTTGTYGAVPSSGQISVQNFYGTTAFTPVYIEEVFKTWLYTGTGAAQTITNGINLSANGGMTWLKCRSTARNHSIVDSARGITKVIYPEFTSAQDTATNLVTAYNTTGFSIGTDASGNASGDTFVSWTFQKKAKFFDVVTYTGTGSPRTVAHNLGSVPGCIITKKVNSTSNWAVYHRELTASGGVYLNLTVGYGADGNLYNNTAPTSSVFTVGGDSSTNASGDTYIAYLFAHDAGGFGAAGTDNVISCGIYAGDGGAGTTNITLGYEPQWILVKQTTGNDNWGMFDNMRGLCVDNNASNDARLIPNASNAEGLIGAFEPTATGFKTTLFTNYNASGRNYIYIAIRRGPMKVPTSGTSVFIPSTANSGTQISTGFNPDLWIGGATAGDGGTNSQITMDRLRGAKYLATTTTAAEIGTNNPFTTGPSNTFTNNVQGGNRAEWLFGRAPSFFDEVCYRGNDVYNRAIPHNLAAVPELVIVKNRTTAGSYWAVYTTTTGSSNLLKLNLTNASASNPYVWGSTAASSTNFYVGDDSNTNGLASGQENYVMYLFATCAGVSKVGSYTGNGTTQTINCGFGAGGARFVLIKRTDATGDWYVYDTARGMTTLTDPYLRLNSTGAEVATLGSVTTVSTGFALNAAILAAINTSSASYIFLAIA